MSLKPQEININCIDVGMEEGSGGNILASPLFITHKSRTRPLWWCTSFFFQGFHVFEINHYDINCIGAGMELSRG